MLGSARSFGHCVLQDIGLALAGSKHSQMSECTEYCLVILPSLFLSPSVVSSSLSRLSSPSLSSPSLSSALSSSSSFFVVVTVFGFVVAIAVGTVLGVALACSGLDVRYVLH